MCRLVSTQARCFGERKTSRRRDTAEPTSYIRTTEEATRKKTEIVTSSSLQKKKKKSSLVISPSCRLSERRPEESRLLTTPRERWVKIDEGVGGGGGGGVGSGSQILSQQNTKEQGWSPRRAPQPPPPPSYRLAGGPSTRCPCDLSGGLSL